MNQTATRCLAALWIAALAVTAPLSAVADEKEKSPETGANVKPAESAPSSKSARRDTYPFRGVIASVDPSARTLTLNGRTTRRVIAVVPETRLTRDGEPTAIDDLKSGEAVGGTLRKNGDGREEALLIRIGMKPESDVGGTKSKGKSSRAKKSEASPP